jgi:hypothetical protein
MVKYNQLAAGLAVIVSTGCVQAPPLDYSKNPDRRDLITTNIGVNTNNVYRQVRYGSSEEGINDLAKCANESVFEEAVVFLPKKEQWIEVGTMEYVNAKGPSAGLVCDGKLNELIRRNNDLIFYHTHPTFEMIIASGEEPDLVYTSTSQEKKAYSFEGYGLSVIGYPDRSYVDECGRLVDFNHALPSNQDLETVMWTVLEHKEEHPNGVMRHRICSTIGVTEYGLSKEGLKKIGITNYPVREELAGFMRVTIDSDDWIVLFKPYTP